MIEIQKSLPPELINPAVELFLSALADKFVPILGSSFRATKLLESNIGIHSCFSALESHRVIGVLAIQTENQNFINPVFKEIKSHYGFWGAVVKSVALDCLQHSPKPGEIHIEGIAVVDSARGQGVGTKLIDALMDFAKNENFKKITLEVIDTNQRALKLYERLGFTIKKRSKIWPVNKIIGWPFDETIFMERMVL